jgi:hypothetical protein
VGLVYDPRELSGVTTTRTGVHGVLQYIHEDVWKTLAELCSFYRQFCAREIKKEMMDKLEKEIPVLLCKLEKNIPFQMV